MLKKIAILFVLTFSVYLFSHQNPITNSYYFPQLADAFLHGRTYVTNRPPELGEMVGSPDKYYVVYPPLPAVVEMPLVAIFGSSFSQPLLSIIAGAIDVILAFVTLKIIFKDETTARWISLLYAFGSTFWFHAEIGSAWYISHILVNLFIWLALLETFTKKRFPLIGFLIGLAFLCRLPAVLAIVFPVILLKPKLKDLLKLAMGILPPVILFAIYNFIRFGSIFSSGYSTLSQNDPDWYHHGLFSLWYIPTHLKELLTSMPTFINKPPFIIPSLFELAVWLVFPALFLIPFANFKKKIIFAGLITALIMLIPDLLHGGNGRYQFGYRYALDCLPFLLVLIADGFKRFDNLWVRLLVGLSILINLWGIVTVSLHLYTL